MKIGTAKCKGDFGGLFCHLHQVSGVGIQLVRLHVRGLAPCHNDKIVPLVRFLPDFRLYSAEGLSDNPSGTASFYRTADFFGGNDSKSVDTPFCGLKITHKGAVYNACSLFEKIAKFSVFFYAYIFFERTISFLKPCSIFLWRFLG